MRTVPSMFAATAADRGDAVALRWRGADGATWHEATWREHADQVARCAAALRDLGVGRGDRVVLMLRNRPEFHVADVATLFLGATPVSIYNSSAPEQIAYLAGHSRASVAIVEDRAWLDRFLAVRADLPGLRHLVVVDGDGDGDAGDDPANGISSWASLLGSAPLDLAQAVGTARPDDLATVIYTSGTTGPPKGVSLDHENIVWTVESFQAAMDGIDADGWRVVSYLPMAHIAERMVSHYTGIARGFEVTTCPEAAEVVPYLVATRPQLLFAVPRVWEKAYAALNAAIGADPAQAEAIGKAREVGWQVSEHRARGEELPAALAQAWDAQVGPALHAVRGRIGLDQCEIAITGAAPIPREILQFFRSLGVPLSEVYGLSETSGPLTWTPVRVKVGTVGPVIPGCEMRLGDDGEVECRGGNIFRGYLDAPDKTAEVLDDDGWFRTGDIGVIDDDGYLTIVDRKKELIITAGGKNISPANLEAALKAGALIGQACVIGDAKPFVSALLVLDPEAATAWAKAHELGDVPLSELAEHPDVRAEVEREVAAANERFSQVERVKRWTLLAQEWQPDSEELTPTMKLKRRGVHKKYADEISALYE